MEKKLQELFLTDYNLLTAQDLAISLSNLADDFSEGIYRIKGTNCNKCYLEYANCKDGLIEFKRLCCNKN